MKRIQFSGLVKLKNKSVLIPKEEIELFEPLEMDLLLPIFLLYFIAVIISVIIFLHELCLKRIFQRKRNEIICDEISVVLKIRDNRWFENTTSESSFTFVN